MLRRSATKQRSRVPAGGLWAVGMFLAIHLVAGWRAPTPMARPSERRKVAAVTAQVRPSIVIAGDSRIESGLIPKAMAEAAGWDPDAAVNIAVPAGEPAATLAVCREYANRFLPGSVLVLGVSAYAMNDHADESLLGDETLAMARRQERFKLTTARRALLTDFLPERDWIRRRFTEPFFEQAAPSVVAESGYRGKRKSNPLTMKEAREHSSELHELWLRQPQLDGVRARVTEEALAALMGMGFQVVVIDPPANPLLEPAIAGTADAAALADFHARLKSLCVKLDVPLLAYGPVVLGPDAESCFVSLMHLNRTGAERFSARVGEDLRRLIGTRLLQPPPPAIRICRSRG